MNKLIYIFVISVAGLFSCDSSHQEKAAKPNIIFILADDLGWTDVGYNGTRYYETPNIDQMAKNGVIFTNAYANAANCAPTRACILSGQYTPRHGVLTVGKSDRGDRLAQQLIPVENQEILDTATHSLAEMLASAGYHTSFIGKWHIGDHDAFSPIAHGFDYSKASWEAGSPSSYFSPYDNPVLEDGPIGENLTDRLTNEAIDYMSSRRLIKDIPFFLYLSYYAVHAPFQGKDSLVKKYREKTPSQVHDNAVYAAMIETLDTNIGKLIDYLNSSGTIDNTIIVFWSDNGGSFRATRNTPLRGSKGMPYEGGVRVPAVVYAPSIFMESKVVDSPVISTDIYTTFMDWGSASIPSNYQVDGLSLDDLISGEKDDNRSIFWYSPVYLPGNKEYAFRMSPSAAIRKGKYKLIWWYAEDSVELFNLELDLEETSNLSISHDAVADSLLIELKEWHTKVGARVPMEQNPSYDPVYASQQYNNLNYIPWRIEK